MGWIMMVMVATCPIFTALLNNPPVKEMLNLIIFGPPGSGKGTQSKKVMEAYGLEHISTGEMLRSEMKSGTPLGVIAKEQIDKGRLVPDNIILGMLTQKLKSCSGAKGIILDGFPRTANQAEALEQMLAQNGDRVDIMLNLEVDDEELIKRLLNRGKTSGRTDDNGDTIAERIMIYNQVTAPVIDFYKNRGVYRSVKGIGSEDEIFARLQTAIDAVLHKRLTKMK